MSSSKLEHQTISILLLGLVGNEVLVELKNDLEFRGILEEVGGSSMDIQLSSVIVTRPLHDGRGGRSTGEHLDNMFVKGSSIRYVHIPDNLNIETCFKQWQQRKARVRDIYKRQNRKQKVK